MMKEDMLLLMLPIGTRPYLLNEAIWDTIERTDKKRAVSVRQAAGSHCSARYRSSLIFVGISTIGSESACAVQQ